MNRSVFLPLLFAVTANACSDADDSSGSAGVAGTTTQRTHTRAGGGAISPGSGGSESGAVGGSSSSAVSGSTSGVAGGSEPGGASGSSSSGVGGTKSGGANWGGNTQRTQAGSSAVAGSSSASTTRSFIVGVGPTWKWYYGQAEDQPVPTPTAATVKDMVLGISESAQMLLAQSGWRAASLGQVPPYFNDLVNVWPKPPVMDNPIAFEFVSYGINFFDQATGVAQLSTPVDPDNDWTNNADAADKYRQTAIALCGAPYNARYIALALEVNTYADRTSLADYAHFVKNVYIPIYDAIKVLDSTISVFVTFQLEQMKGLGNEWGFAPKLHFELLNQYEGKLDLVAFTSYPEFVYDAPSDIPNDYYTSIVTALPESLRIKPLAFVELGWSDRHGTVASQRAQTEFLARFLTLTRGLNISYANWVFLHDEHSQPVNPKLRLGLKDYNGNPRPIWQAWRELKALPYLP